MNYTLHLTETERVVAFPDLTSYDFDEVVGPEYSLFVTAAGYSTTSYGYGIDQDLIKNLEHLSGRFLNVELRERAITLYLGLLGYAAEVIQLRGCSQGEWLRGVIFTDKANATNDETAANMLTNATELANAWFAGDIYAVARERLETYVNVTDVTDTITKWVEIEDPIGAVIIRDGKDLIQFAYDEYQIPKLDWKVTCE